MLTELSASEFFSASKSRFSRKISISRKIQQKLVIEELEHNAVMYLNLSVYVL